MGEVEVEGSVSAIADEGRSAAVAPYWRFRRTYEDDPFPGGAYTADIAGCDWACEGCWSKFGWRTLDARHTLSAGAVAARMVSGMERGDQAGSRLTGGEPALHWDHVIGLCEAFVELTDHQGLEIETRGVELAAEQLDAIDLERIRVVVGLKATTPEWLAQLTGMEVAEASAAHEAQLTTLLYLAGAEHLAVSATVLDKYADQGLVSELAAAGIDVRVLRFGRFGNATAFYTPPHLERRSKSTRAGSSAPARETSRRKEG